MHVRKGSVNVPCRQIFLINVKSIKSYKKQVKGHNAYCRNVLKHWAQYIPSKNKTCVFYQNALQGLLDPDV